MNNELYRIRKAVENVCQLMEMLVTLQQTDHKCCREVSMPAEAAAAQQHVAPAAPVPEILYNRKAAADYLLVHPRTVTRYRACGKLLFVYNEDDQIRYRESDLATCYFWKWGKHP